MRILCSVHFTAWSRHARNSQQQCITLNTCISRCRGSSVYSESGGVTIRNTTVRNHWTTIFGHVWQLRQACMLCAHFMRSFNHKQYASKCFSGSRMEAEIRTTSTYIEGRTKTANFQFTISMQLFKLNEMVFTKMFSAFMRLKILMQFLCSC